MKIPITITEIDCLPQIYKIEGKRTRIHFKRMALLDGSNLGDIEVDIYLKSSLISSSPSSLLPGDNIYIEIPDKFISGTPGDKVNENKNV